MVTVDLRIVAPEAVKNGATPDSHKYNEGARYASLKGIMQAKKKPIEQLALSALGVDTALSTSYAKFELPPARSGAVTFVDSVDAARSTSSTTKPRSSEPDADWIRGERLMTDVLVVAELIDGGLAQEHAVGGDACAKQVAEGTGGAFDILAIGEGAKNAAAQAAKFGARKVLATEIAGGYLAEKLRADRRRSGEGRLRRGHRDRQHVRQGPPAARRCAARRRLRQRHPPRRRSRAARSPTSARCTRATCSAACTVNTPVQVVSVRQSEFEAAAEAGGGEPGVEDVRGRRTTRSRSRSSSCRCRARRARGRS